MCAEEEGVADLLHLHLRAGKQGVKGELPTTPLPAVLSVLSVESVIMLIGNFSFKNLGLERL